MCLKLCLTPKNFVVENTCIYCLLSLLKLLSLVARFVASLLFFCDQPIKANLKNLNDIAQPVNTLS